MPDLKHRDSGRHTPVLRLGAIGFTRPECRFSAVKPDQGATAEIFANRKGHFPRAVGRAPPRAQNIGAARATRWRNNRERPVAQKRYFTARQIPSLNGRACKKKKYITPRTATTAGRPGGEEGGGRGTRSGKIKSAGPSTSRGARENARARHGQIKNSSRPLRAGTINRTIISGAPARRVRCH